MNNTEITFKVPDYSGYGPHMYYRLFQPTEYNYKTSLHGLKTREQVEAFTNRIIQAVTNQIKKEE